MILGFHGIDAEIGVLLGIVFLLSSPGKEEVLAPASLSLRDFRPASLAFPTSP